jgi:hypothetical protein
VVFKTCPLCQQRRPKRECPAVGQTICAVCCGTKRQGEITCPPDCAYLSSARAHPAAATQRRRERDFRVLLPLIQDLSEPQYRLLLAFQAIILKHAGSALPAPQDADVGDAAGTLASTIETAGRGIIYEHRTASVPAQRMVAELRELLAEIERESPAAARERDAATALRRIEQGARDAAAAFPEDGATAYLGLLSRMMSDLGSRTAQTTTGGEQPDRRSGVIIAP